MTTPAQSALHAVCVASDVLQESTRLLDKLKELTEDEGVLGVSGTPQRDEFELFLVSVKAALKLVRDELNKSEKVLQILEQVARPPEAAPPVKNKPPAQTELPIDAEFLDAGMPPGDEELDAPVPKLPSRKAKLPAGLAALKQRIEAEHRGRATAAANRAMRAPPDDDEGEPPLPAEEIDRRIAAQLAREQGQG